MLAPIAQRLGLPVPAPAPKGHGVVLLHGLGRGPGSMAVLAGVALVTLGCAWFFPDRPEELRPELWAGMPGTVPAE